MPQFAPPFVSTSLRDAVTNGGHLLARWTHVIDEDSNYSLQAYWDRYDRDLGLIASYVTDTYDVDFQHEFTLGDRQKINYGLGYRYTDFFFPTRTDDTGFLLLDGTPEHRDSHLFSAFLQVGPAGRA